MSSKRTSAVRAWMCVDVCAVAAAVAAILYGNTNPSGAAEVGCAFGVDEYCRQLEQAAQLHSFASGLLWVAGVGALLSLIWALFATVPTAESRDGRGR